MNTPSQESEGLEVICVGSFNPKIFHPAWFRKFEIISEADMQDAVVRMVSSDVADIEMKGIRIQCVKEKLTAGTSDPTRYEMMQDWLLSIFSLLPHIPMTMLGINSLVHYRLFDDVDRWHRIGDRLAPKDLWTQLFAKPGLLTLTTQSERTDGFEGVINVTVEPSIQFRPGVFVRTNHHFQPTKPQEIKAFTNFLETIWQTARDDAKRVAAKIFEEIK
jgi:hypothetical protein